MTQADRDRLVDVEESEEETDHAARGSRRTGVERAAGEAAAVRAEEAWRQGRDSRAAGEAIEPEDRRERRAGGGEDLVGAGVSRGSGRPWRRSIWGRNTGSRRAKRRCGSG